MAQILCFARNRCIKVEQLDEQTIRSSCRLQDTRMEISVELLIKLPHLEISQAQGLILQAPEGRDRDVSNFLQKAVGVRIGSGLKKILKGIKRNSAIDNQLIYMVGECCDGVILAFTKDVLLHAPHDPDKEIEFFKNVVQANPRLYDSCAAFAPGSPLVEGIEPD